VTCRAVNGEDPADDDDAVEFEATIGKQSFLFRCEAASDEDVNRLFGLLGVEDKATGERCHWPSDAATWKAVRSLRALAGVVIRSSLWSVP